MRINFAPVKEKTNHAPRVKSSIFADVQPKVNSTTTADRLVYHLGRLKSSLCGAPVEDTEANGPFHTYPLGPNVLKLEDWRLMHHSHRCPACMSKLN